MIWLSRVELFIPGENGQRVEVLTMSIYADIVFSGCINARGNLCVWWGEKGAVIPTRRNIFG